MTFLRELQNTNIYECDGCGKVSPWRNGWSVYGSYLHIETCSTDLPVACSDKCANCVLGKIKSKKFVLPGIKNKGYYSDKVSERKGY